MLKTFISDIKRFKFLFLIVIPGMLYFIIFCYLPMIGLVIAFQDFKVTKGIFGSPWVGMKHFIDFFSSVNSFRIIRNTLLLNIYALLWGFPIPIIFAVALCELKSIRLRKFIQTASYLPYFISNVIAVGIAYMLINVDSGVINVLLNNLFGIEKTNFLIESRYFRTIYVIIDIWKGFGWTAVIYMAAIIGIDPQLYESATIDGASKMRLIWNITIPCISSTIVVMLLLNIGNMMSIGFERVYLLYNPLTYDVGDVISTYIYRRGILGTGGLPEFSYTTAVGLFQSVVNVLMLTVSNRLVKKWSGYGLY